MKRTIVAMVQIDTDDPLLDPDRIVSSSVEATIALRAAVVRALPGLTSVVAVLPLDTAKLMMSAHDQAWVAAGLGHPKRPPPGYRPPHRRR